MDKFRFLHIFGLIAEAPFDALPVLEVDGVKVPQTLAILRYIARETGESNTFQNINSSGVNEQ